MSDPFIGEIRIWACNFAPRSWAFCNGALLPISQNTALFSILGTTYGGDGRSTLGLPNLQGRTVLHAGQGAGLSRRRQGEYGGANLVAMNSNQIAPHTHLARGMDEDASSTDPTGRYYATADDDAYSDDETKPDAVMHSHATDNSGGGQPHNNVQPCLGVNYCIALMGLYPSRS